MSIPEEIVEQIRQRSDIVDIIGEVVDLKKRGANFIGLCPFHQEKTPSFTVSQEKQIYKCFGCGAKGNVISFMLEYHKMSYPEALRELASKAGIQISEKKEVKRVKEEISKHDLVLKAIDAAALFYHKTLNSTAGSIAKSYFNKRGFTPETISKFFLGYSPDSWDSILKELTKSGFTEEILLEAGLIIQRENGGFYDRFRGRAMFPIQDLMGKIIGFGARQMEDIPEQPKYINSPQTIVYDKSNSLYGLYQAKNTIRTKKSIILVEGYADVISLHQAGYDYAVASSGTSLTKEQLHNISKLCKTIYIVYDSDSAGIKATERAIELALADGFELNIVQLPQGEDPDSLIKNNGFRVFQSYLNDTITFLDFKVELYKKNGLLQTAAQKSTTIQELIHLISKIPDKLQHDFYISRLSALLRISEYQLYKVYEKKSQNQRSDNQKKSESPPRKLTPEEQESILNRVSSDVSSKENKNISNSLLPEESILIKLACSKPETLSIMVNQFQISEKNFITDTGKRLFSILVRYLTFNEDIINQIISDVEINSNDKDFIISSSFEDMHISDNWSKFSKEIGGLNYDKLINDSLSKLELSKIDKELEEVRSILKGISNTPDSFEKQLHYLQYLKELTLAKDKIIKSKLE